MHGADSSDDAPGATGVDDRSVAARLWAELGGPATALAGLELTGPRRLLRSRYPVGALATAAVSVAGLALGELGALRGARHGPLPPSDPGAVPVQVDRRLVAAAFAGERLLQAEGWALPALLDPLMGDYRTADGWIRLHTNYAGHRRAALAVLGLGVDLDDPGRMARAASGWSSDELESAVVAAGGAAAALRSPAAWSAHPQGRAVAAEPLVSTTVGSVSDSPAWATRATSDEGEPAPLAGVRVLDLTRVIAGPVATRLLAGFGAQVVRVDPPGFVEVPALVPELTTGKWCTALDLRHRGDRDRFAELVAEADVAVVGLRPGALAALGFDEAWWSEHHPGLILAELDAYGWSGPWAGRRGYDSLVQLSTGIAHPGGEGSGPAGDDRPVPLPVQALDHGTGYLLAAAVVRALGRRLREGRPSRLRVSLARTARLLAELGRADAPVGRELGEDEVDACREPVDTAWGPVRRVRDPLTVAGRGPRWSRPAGPLGSAEARWPPQG